VFHTISPLESAIALMRTVVYPTRKPAATIIGEAVQVKIVQNMTQFFAKRRMTEGTAVVWKSQMHLSNSRTLTEATGCPNFSQADRVGENCLNDMTQHDPLNMILSPHDRASA
jgi:hypothetical protein